MPVVYSVLQLPCYQLGNHKAGILGTWASFEFGRWTAHAACRGRLHPKYRYLDQGVQAAPVAASAASFVNGLPFKLYSSFAPPMFDSSRCQIPIHSTQSSTDHSQRN